METKIVLCEFCGGAGKHPVSEEINHHTGDCDEWEECCEFCDGTGRMVAETHLRKMLTAERVLSKRPKKA